MPKRGRCLPEKFVSTWAINPLVSNRFNQAANRDPDLQSPWGIQILDNQLWIADNRGDRLANYDLLGNPLQQTITLRNFIHNAAFQSGIAVNRTGGFSTGNLLGSSSADFIIVNETGSIQAVSKDDEGGLFANLSNLVINRTLQGEVHVFTGVDIGDQFAYVADFFRRRVDVFDGTYTLRDEFPFVDGNIVDPIPRNYAPYNVAVICGLVYVLWAQQGPIVRANVQSGPQTGFVSVFNQQGGFLRRFTSRGVLNAPWAMIPAPPDCGFPPGSFLIGNRGDGRINAFDCNGGYLGPMLNQSGQPIQIQGLVGLAPFYCGVDATGQRTNQVFFTASRPEINESLVGSIVRSQLVRV